MGKPSDTELVVKGLKVAEITNIGQLRTAGQWFARAVKGCKSLAAKQRLIFIWQRMIDKWTY